MIEKLEKLIDAATAFFERSKGCGALRPIDCTCRGASAPDAPDAPGGPLADKPAPKTRAKRTSTAPAAENVAESAFGLDADYARRAEDKLSVEQSVEAGRRGQEVMGLFIRRYLKASPTGLERAKTIIEKHLGRPRNGEASWKLEHFTPQDWLKLTPVFQDELEKAEAGK